MLASTRRTITTPKKIRFICCNLKKNTRQPLLIHDSARAFAINRKKKSTLPIIFVTAAAAVVALRLLMRWKFPLICIWRKAAHRQSWTPPRNTYIYASHNKYTSIYYWQAHQRARGAGRYIRKKLPRRHLGMDAGIARGGCVLVVYDWRRASNSDRRMHARTWYIFAQTNSLRQSRGAHDACSSLIIAGGWSGCAGVMAE